MATGAIILGGIAAAGTAYSVYQGRQAAKAQKRATDVQRRQQTAEEARARRAQITEARRKRAAVVNATAAGGLSGSSGAVGGLGALQSQLGGNLGFTEQSSTRSGEYEGFMNKANSANWKGSVGSAVAGLALQGSSMFGTPSAGNSTVRQAGASSPLFDTPGPNPRG